MLSDGPNLVLSAWLHTNSLNSFISLWLRMDTVYISTPLMRSLKGLRCRKLRHTRKHFLSEGL